MDLLSAALQWLREEWSDVRKAPAAFAVTLLLAFLVAWWVTDWAYSSRLAAGEAERKVLETRIQGLTETIAAKDGQVEEYRQRLGLVPREGKFAKLANAELVAETNRFVAAIRTFDKPYETKYRASFGEYENEKWNTTKPKGPGDVQRYLDAMEEAYRHHHDRFMPFIGEEHELWEKRFQPDAIVLRDELLARLPIDREERSWPRPPYAADCDSGKAPHPGEVADDLEALARAVPAGDLKAAP